MNEGEGIVQDPANIFDKAPNCSYFRLYGYVGSVIPTQFCPSVHYSMKPAMNNTFLKWA